MLRQLRQMLMKKADSIDVNLGTQGSKQDKDARVAAHKVQKDNQVNETTFNLNTNQLKNSNNDVKEYSKVIWRFCFDEF